MKEKRMMPAILLLLLFTFHFSLFTFEASAGLIDRVAAFVDLKVITLSELRETYERTKKAQPDITMEEVLNTMINRLVLLEDAKRLKIEGKTDDEIVNEYIELKVKALIRVKEESIEEYYKKNEQNFGGAPFDAVRDKIEEYLLEREANDLLRKQIAGLRAKAYVRVLPGVLE